MISLTLSQGSKKWFDSCTLNSDSMQSIMVTLKEKKTVSPPLQQGYFQKNLCINV